MYKTTTNGEKSEHYFRCEAFQSSLSYYIPCRALLATGASTWEFNTKAWDELMLGKIFRDDEDSTKLFYVAEYKYFTDFRKFCFYCVPFMNAQSLENIAKDVDEYDDDFVHAVDYVHLRVQLYEMETNPLQTSSSNRNAISSMALKATDKAVSGSSKRMISVHKHPTKLQSDLAGRTFTTEGKKGKSYYVVEVKYLKEYKQVCCCCVPYTRGDDVEIAVEEARKANNYSDKSIFDCDYVRTRVDV